MRSPVCHFAAVVSWWMTAEYLIDCLSPVDLDAGVMPPGAETTGQALNGPAMLPQSDIARAARANRRATMQQPRQPGTAGNTQPTFQLHTAPSHASRAIQPPHKNHRGGAGTPSMCSLCGQPRKGTHKRKGCPTHCSACRKPDADCVCQIPDHEP